MSSRDRKEYVVYDAVAPQTVTSSTDATPIVVTKTAHGYSTGDYILIYGHATNVAANGIWKITVLSSSTFSLQDINTGANVAGSGAGAGSGGVMIRAPKILCTEDFRNIIFSLHTSGSLNATLKVAGSLGKPVSNTTQGNDTPNFGATQSKSNPFTFLQIIDLQGAATIDGDTGIVSAGTDINKTYEVNVNGMKYITIIPTAWSAGTITVKAQLYNNQ